MGAKVYALFLPWIVFAAVDRAYTQSIVWAGAAAVLCAIVTVPRVRHRSVPPLRICVIGLFLGLALSGLLLRGDSRHFADEYARALAAGGLALLGFGSLSADPISDHLTRPLVTARLAASTRFRRVNYVMSLTWAAGAAAIMFSYIVADTLDTQLGWTVFNWLVPISVALLALALTERAWLDFLDEDSPVDRETFFLSLLDDWTDGEPGAGH